MNNTMKMIYDEIVTRKRWILRGIDNTEESCEILREEISKDKIDVEVMDDIVDSIELLLHHLNEINILCRLSNRINDKEKL